MKNYLRYIYAILAIPLSILMRFALVPLIGYGIPYIMLFPVTVGVALLAGMGPAVVTGFLGAIITDYFFVPPIHTITLDVQHITRASVMVLTSIFVGYVGNALKSARAKAEKQALSFQESETRLKRSQEIAHLGSWELDLVNNVLVWSDEIYRIFGLQPQEFDATYEAFLEAVHPDDRTLVNEAYSGSLRDGRDIYEIEHRIVRKSTGEIRHVHEKCAHIRNESGQIIRSVGMVHDITDHKKAEDSLIRAKEEWERTFDTVPDLIAILDNSHRILRINKAMAHKLGMEPGQCVGLPCYKYVHGLSEPPAFCPHTCTVRDGRQHIEEVHEERFGGHFLVSTTPMFDERGAVIGSVHVARDITERKRAEEEVIKLNEELKDKIIQLEAANNELDAFSYSVSHDLRAPLRSVAGFSQALLDDYAGKLDADGKDYLERIIAATRRMGLLIDDLLKLSRLSRAEMNLKRVSLSDLAVRIAEGIRKEHPEREVDIKIAGGLFAYGDELLLNVVLENLLDNAWKFTGKNARAVIEFGATNFGMRNAECGLKDQESGNDNQQGTVSQSALQNPKSALEKVVYFVKDNGAGFDMSYAGKMFSPFQRLHSLSEFPGTGIGLATVKRVIERHGGKVWIDAEVGKGATVYFTL